MPPPLKQIETFFHFQTFRSPFQQFFLPLSLSRFLYFACLRKIFSHIFDILMKIFCVAFRTAKAKGASARSLDECQQRAADSGDGDGDGDGNGAGLILF